MLLSFEKNVFFEFPLYDVFTKLYWLHAIIVITNARSSEWYLQQFWSSLFVIPSVAIIHPGKAIPGLMLMGDWAMCQVITLHIVMMYSMLQLLLMVHFMNAQFWVARSVPSPSYLIQFRIRSGIFHLAIPSQLHLDRLVPKYQLFTVMESRNPSNTQNGLQLGRYCRINVTLQHSVAFYHFGDDWA